MLPLEADDVTLTPGELLGPYEILTPLGSGGMERSIALAIGVSTGRWQSRSCPQELTGSSQALERFQREARAASALNHPKHLHRS